MARFPHRGAFKIASRLERQCRVCKHAARIEIELLLAGGAGQKALASRFGMSKDSIHRHWSRHIDAKRKARLLVGPVQEQALRARIAEEASSVVDLLRATRAGLFESYDLALKISDLNAVAQLASKIHENLKIAGNISGELASSPLVQINNNQQNNIAMLESPDFVRFQARLIAVLRDYPEARNAVLAEFEKFDAPDALPLPQLTQQDKVIQTIEQAPADAQAAA